MTQITEFGKEVRKIRIDRETSLKEMADTLRVPSSYISAVERGRKPLTQEFVEKVIANLGVSDELAKKLRDASVQSMNSITLDISSFKNDAKQTAAVFARRVNTMNPEQLKKLRQIMEK